MTHSEIVEAAYRWLKSETECGFALREYKSSRFSKEIPDVVGFDAKGFSYVVECKASRSDFLADAQKFFRLEPEKGMGSYRYYCCPEGMIKVEDLPRGWGLVHVSPDEQRAYCVVDPIEPSESGEVRRFERNKDAEYLIMYSALRRLDLRGQMETIYDKVTATQAASMRQVGSAGVTVGQIWFKKTNPHQRVKIHEVQGHIIMIESVKSGACDPITPDKLTRHYAKETE